MTRPTYESQQDRDNEQATIRFVEAAWKCEAQKLPKAYSLDYALMRMGRVAAWAEVKCRGKRYPTYMISLHKVMDALDLAERTKAPALLLVQYPGELLYKQLEESDTADIRVGGREDRGDWQDKEPVVHIPMEKFKTLGVRAQ